MTTENVTIQDLLTALLYWRSKAKEYEARLEDAKESYNESYCIGYVNGRQDAENARPQS
jgi:hypothetical protein